MSKAILITRPDHDLITTYLFQWSEHVIHLANKKNIKVLDLSGKRANEKTFTSYMIKNEPVLVFFNGHGNEDVITGYNNEPLVAVNKNEKLLEKKIVYARSCNAAENLGELCIKNKTLVFIGYKKKYTICYSHASVSHPLQDDIAKLFITPSNLVPMSFLKGNTAKDAYRKSQESMARNFSYMLSTRAISAQKDAAPYLWINKKYQVLLGDPNASM
ncbi:MAG: hypothetical protein HYV39_03540 [Candidatus Levybacteria bacterium]|nr:hypothetical protein [Candidatus Levybacteria bacterium]